MRTIGRHLILRSLRGPLGLAALVLAMGTATSACRGPAPAPTASEPIFVRGGLLLDGGTEGAPLGRYRWLAKPWAGGEEVTLADRTWKAPLRPDCVPVWQYDLGDVRRWITQGGEGPDTAIAFSPDGQSIAVGTFLGDLLVLDSQSGALVHRTRLSETMVKAVAWSPDGGVLFAGEQSPDAWVHALDTATWERRWRFRLADDLGLGRVPAGEDVYGAYALPAAYAIHPLSDGGLFVAGTHGWAEPDGRRATRTRLYRLDPGGAVVSAWPKDGAADAATFHPRVDEPHGLVLAGLSRSEESGGGPARLLLLDLGSLEPRAEIAIEPLSPWYTQAFLWESLDLDAEAGVIAAGLGDGRLMWFGLDGSGRRSLELGTPRTQSDVPIAASVGFLRLRSGTVLSQTSGTTIPWGAAAPQTRPPALHPSENALWAHGLDGSIRWTLRTAHRLNGLQIGGDGKTLLAGAGPRVSDSREDLFGALLVDLDGEGSGADRHRCTCATEGPIFFRPQMNGAGLVAMAEFPFRRPDGSLAGAYRLTVSR